MDFPLPSKDELEEILKLAEEAWKNPGIPTWTALADRLFEDSSDVSTVEDEEKEYEEKEIDEINYDEILHALVEVAWEAWKNNPSQCQSWVRVGIEGDMESGIPPFLNMRAGTAHLNLALFLERAGEITLSQNAQTLGRVLLLFHMSEAYVRPGMATGAFLLNIWMGNPCSFEDILLYNHKWRGIEMATYGATRDSFLNAIQASQKIYQNRMCLDVLDNFMSNENAEVTLSELRNAVGHHNIDILDGAIRIGWLKGYPNFDDNYLKSIPFDDLKDFLWSLRGFVMTLSSWEHMMLIVFQPPDDLENFDASVVADGLHAGLTLMKGLFQPFI